MASYNEKDKIKLVLDNLTNNYNDVITQMKTTLEMVKQNPNNKELVNLLYSLTGVATKIIGTQISFSYIYVDEKEREQIVDKLMEKKQQLLSSVATELSDLEVKKVR